MTNPKARLLRNIFSNWATLAVSAGIAFYMSPFLVHQLGKEQYGIWALVFSIIAYTEFFDMGMRQSLARYLPKYYATEDWLNLNRVINTSTAMYSVIGTLTMVASLVIAFTCLGLFNVSEELMYVMKITLIIVGANAAIAFYGMAVTALGPFHRYDLANAIAIVLKIASTAVILYMLFNGWGLITLAVITLVTTIVRSVTKGIVLRKIVPAMRLGCKYVSRKTARELVGYGFISFLIVIAWLVIFNSQNVIIGIFLSAEAVTYFAIAMTVIQYMRSLVQAIGIPLVPAISHLEATKDLETVRNLSAKMLRYLYYLCTGICCGVLIYGRDFVGLWMGPGFDLTVDILFILIVAATIYLPQTTSNSVLLGVGKHRLLFYILAGEATANIILSIALVGPYGLHGVAMGTAIPQIIVYAFIYPIAYHRVLKASVKTFYIDALKASLFAIAVSGPCAYAIRELIAVDGWVTFFVDVGITSLIMAVGMYFMILDNEDRQRLLKLVGR